MDWQRCSHYEACPVHLQKLESVDHVSVGDKEHYGDWVYTPEGISKPLKLIGRRKMSGSLVATGAAMRKHSLITQPFGFHQYTAFEPRHQYGLTK